MFLLDLIFPPCCAHCRKILRKGSLCERCAQKIERNTNLFCGNCRNRLPDPYLRPPCHPQSFTLGAAIHYNEIAKSLIRDLKFNYIKDAGKDLGDILLGYIKEISPDWEGFILVPVPLSRRRLRERGFNQAELIAQELSAGLDLPLITSVLQRTKNTFAQSSLGSVEERELNLWNAFSASGVKGKKILLVDDVVTSGATLRSAFHALKSAGAREVVCLAAAQA